MVLVIDDSADDRDLICRALFRSDITMELWQFDDGQPAVEFFQHLSDSPLDVPDPLIVFCDIRMPGRNGFEVIEQLRSLPRLANTRVYFLSSSNENRDRERARQLGAWGYCLKFPTPQDFRRMIENKAPVAICDV